MVDLSMELPSIRDRARDVDSALLRLLCLQANQADAKPYIRHLKNAGYSVGADVVESLGEFRDALRSKPYDVVLADYALGGFTGLEALAALNSIDIDIPFIFLTRSMGDDVAVECMKKGATDYILTDSISDQPDRLALAVERALREKAAQAKRRSADDTRRKDQAVAYRNFTGADVAMRAAKEAAETASLAKSEFLSSMSHEIRTPMNAILGMADLLSESNLDAEQREYVAVFRRAGASLLAIINNILDLSKIESGHFEIEKIEFNLDDVIERSLELAALQANEKGLAIISRIAPGVPTLLIGDPTRLQQVIINLLGNSLKFTEKGEIVLSVQPHASGKPGFLEITVSDTGVGIAPEKLRCIFDDFTQADASITRKHGGTGLGLGICRRLVEYMGGQITVESLPGVGSTFHFSADFAIGAAMKRPAEVNDFHGRRVLVMESDPTNRMIYRESLNAWGLVSSECVTARDGSARLSEGIRKGEAYSLVILDRHLFDMDGFEAIPLIRSVDPAVPIVMLTAESRPGEATRGRAAGLSGYAVKPVKRTELLRLVCDALSKPSTQPHGHTANPVLPAIAAALRPLRILIAEDSSDNQLLLRAYLKNTPYTLTFVEDGQRAVEEFKTAHSKNAGYHLILMDIQMPLLDGLGATRFIREVEQERDLTPTPILALTASALAHDLEASNAAGCNAHLSKPISKQKLLTEIERHASFSKASDDPGPIFVQIPPDLEELVPGYLADRKREIAVFRQLLDAFEFDQIRILAHNLKGNGASFGFPELGAIGAAMERSARKSDLAALGRQLLELSSYLGRVQLKP